MTKKFALIIPARYKSSRFPGKPLAKISNKTMIQIVWERACKVVNKKDIFIATDDNRISDEVKGFGGNIILTSSDCLTGTDRVAEANNILNKDFIINVQGDEPLIDPKSILAVIDAYKNTGDAVCGITKIKESDEYFSPNVPKVVFCKDNYLLYISRSAIPANKKFTFNKAYKQVCIYAFSKEHLKLFGPNKSKTTIEKIEDIEIIRLIENGYRVKLVNFESSSMAVDTPEDLNKVRLIYENK